VVAQWKTDWKNNTAKLTLVTAVKFLQRQREKLEAKKLRGSSPKSLHACLDPQQKPEVKCLQEFPLSKTEGERAGQI